MIPSSVQTFIGEPHPPETALYLLLDPLACGPQDAHLHLATLRQELHEAAFTVLPRPDLAHTPDACPVLVTLAAPGCQPCAQLIELSILHSRQDANQPKRYVCGWLRSAAAPETIAAHIVALGQPPQKQHSQYFPVHEPLRLELLAAACKDVGHEPWWPIQQWLFPTSSGATSLLIGHPEQVAALGIHVATAQQDVPIVDALLRSWRRALDLPLTYAPLRWNGPTALPPHAAIQAYGQIRQARALKLHHQHDLMTLALYRLTVHPRLHEHPGVRNLINQAIAGQATLGTLFSPYNDRAWERLACELTDTGTVR